MVKIAIADDLELVRLGIASVVRRCKNHDVILEAKDGKDLIDKLSLLEQLPDVCIIETNNNILNNYNTLIDLQTLYPKIRILALSIYDLKYTVIKMIQHGVRGYLLKKYSINELHAAIENVCSNDYHYSKIAPESLFEIARQETLPKLTEGEYQLLVLTAYKFREKEIPALMFVQQNMVGDSFHSIINKLKLHDNIELAIYMMQSGLIPPNHFI